MLNAFTVDVEDYYHVSAFESRIDRGAWGNYRSRVVDNTTRLLDLLDHRGVKATFFVLGWVADHFPDAVRKIVDRGHEVGCHSYWHRLVYQQTRDGFREDLRRATGVLSDIVGRPVTAYRAPSFSITKDSLWALEILVEEGYRFDSSIFPTRHDRYGIPNAEPRIHRVSTPAGYLCEFPPTIVSLFGIKIPTAGGGYFRIKPWGITKRLLHHVNRHAMRPFMFYIHPWEVDPTQPRIAVKSRLSRFRHYVNLSSTERKLERLLGEFRFAPMSTVAAHYLAATKETVGQDGGM